MGFLDKVTNKMDSYADQTKSKLGEAEDVSKVKSQIHDEEKKVRDNTNAIGEEYIKYIEDGDGAHMETMKKLAQEVIESKKKIQELEKQCEDIKNQAHEDREKIRAETDAKNAEIDAANKSE